MDSSLNNKLIEGFSSTWIERLAMNLLSYSIILLPIAFIVIVTKFRLGPASFESIALIQWFVYGKNANKLVGPQQAVEDEKFLLDEKSEKTRQLKRIDESRKKSVLEFLWCLVGLQVSYLIWGLLQEKIMTTEYASTSPEIRAHNINRHIPGSQVDLNLSSLNGLHLSNSSQTTNNKPHITFHDSQFLVFINRIVAFLMAILALVISRRRESEVYKNNRTNLIHYVTRSARNSKPQAPLYEYVYCSLSNILSSWCQYEALKYINFPTQCLSKSCKVIPVMLMSKILLNKKHSIIEYFCASLLAVGMFIFMLNQPPSTTSTVSHINHHIINGSTPHNLESSRSLHSTILNNSNSTLISGLLILALYLTFDSFTSNWQQSLYSRYGISNWQMMAAINFYSILLTLTSLHQLGNLRPAIKLIVQSSVLMRDLLLMSIMSSIGQMFVYYTIKRFGSVIFAVIMTLRQFFSILLSCAIYGHQLDFNSSLGLVLVFAVVAYQVWAKSSKYKADSTGSSKLIQSRAKINETNASSQFMSISSR